MNRLCWLGVLGTLAACSDYDLHRPDKDNEPAEQEPEEIPEEEPSEDPDIEISPATIDFGGLPKDCPAEPVDLVISNVGLGTLEISEIVLNGSGNSAFNLQWDGSPFSLEYGESRAIQVEFTPDAWVDYAINTRVTSNDPDEGTVSAPTEGFGAEDSMYEESFVQDYNEKVDVLWVVDNSCSMGEELNQVTSNFSTFIDEWVNLDLDYHLGVITTALAATAWELAKDCGIKVDQKKIDLAFKYIRKSTVKKTGYIGYHTEKGFYSPSGRQGLAVVAHRLAGDNKVNNNSCD